MNTKNCLILIDMQNDYFPKGKMELCRMNEAAAKAKLLLAQFRELTLPIVHIQHIATRPGSTFFLPDSYGAEIHELVAPLATEPIIKKHYPNSFRETPLLKTLREKNIEEVTLCGAMSHMCADATTRAAFDFGFACTVADDACATRDLLFQGREVKAADAHAAFMAALSFPYAEVRPTLEIIGSFA